MSNISSKLTLGARGVLGLIFLVFGLNGFVGFLPQPALPEAAGAFLGGLAGAGYFFPLLKGVEVLAGVALLFNRFVPLALTVLAPITVNIFLFHTFLAPALALPVLIVALQGYLAYAHRDAFRPMLQAQSAALQRASTAEHTRRANLARPREAV